MIIKPEICLIGIMFSPLARMILGACFGLLPWHICPGYGDRDHDERIILQFDVSLGVVFRRFVYILYIFLTSPRLRNIR